MTRSSLIVVCWLAACARSAAPDASPRTVTTQAASGSGSGSGSASASASASASGSASASIPPGLEGEDFVAEARVLFRIAACGSAGEAPPRLDADVIARHCAQLDLAYRDYRKAWVDEAEVFFDRIRPRGLSSTAVYPFGGGDLVSALATFPDADEITTISLEPAGDVRAVDHLPAGRLAFELGVHRAHLERLLQKAHSRTDNLDKEAHTDLPGEIVFALGALAVHGGEPVSLRYFRLRPDGSLVFVTQADIDAASHHPVALHALFENVELRFRKLGDAGKPTQTFRHLSFNLDDAHLRADPALLAHLDLKGNVAAMTKAASHLLWSSHFSLIRTWLTSHTDWMVSDSTGIPPRYAQASGFTQETFGTFSGPAQFGLVDDRDANDFKRLFASQPARALGFRYGYPDRDGHAHLIVTRRERD